MRDIHSRLFRSRFFAAVAQFCNIVSGGYRLAAGVAGLAALGGLHNLITIQDCETKCRNFGAKDRILATEIREYL